MRYFATQKEVQNQKKTNKKVWSIIKYGKKISNLYKKPRNFFYYFKIT